MQMTTEPRMDTPSQGNPSLANDKDPLIAALEAEADLMGQERQQEAETYTQKLDAQSQAGNPMARRGAGGGRLGSEGGSPINSLQAAIGTGAAKAFFEAKDFVMGEPNYADKSEWRKNIERTSDNVRMASGINAMAGSISQFITGLAGAGKIMGPLKGIKTLGRGIAAGFESLKAAGTGAIVFDPHEQRLSDLIEEFPSLSNPITDYLASDLSDSAAEGRLKSAAESIGMDAVLAGAFALGLKGLKLLKTDAPKAIKQGEKLIEQANQELVKRQGIAGQAQGIWDMAKDGPAARIGDRHRPDASPQTAQGAPMEPAPQVDSGIAPAAETPPPTPASPATGNAPEAVPPAPKLDAAPPLPQPQAVKPITSAAEIGEDEAKRIIDIADTTKAAQLTAGSEYRGVAPGGLINWTKVQGPNEAGLYLQRVAEITKARLMTIKGGDVLSDAKVRQMIEARADLFGDDPALVLGNLRQQGANATQMVADMEASYAIANAIMQDSYKLAQKIKYGALDQWGGNLDAALEEFHKVTSTGVEMLAAARSMTANAGRSMRRMRGGFKVSTADIEKFKTTDPAALVEAIYHSQGNPKDLAKALSPGILTRIGKGFEFAIVNGPLWWYPTHVANAMSSLYMLGARPLEKIIGASVMGRAGAPIRKQALKEYRFMASALWDGFTAASKAWTMGDSVLAPQVSYAHDLGVASQQLPFKPLTDISSLLHNALVFAKPQTLIGLPTRALGTVDEFIKVIRYRGVVQAQAAQEAADQGLTGQAALSYISRRLDDAFDDGGQALDANALREAQATTFTQPLQDGTLGHWLQTGVTKMPLLRSVFTYVRTPINALRYTVKMTPGLNMLQTEYRNAIAGKTGPEAQAHAIGQMALGGLIMGMGGLFASAGKLTGAGPSDPKLRAELQAQGWRPYSFIWEREDGTRRYLPLGRIDPIGMLFGIMADFHDISQHPDKFENAQDALSAAGIALWNNVANRTYLQSLQMTVRAMAEPDKFMARWLGNTAESALPFSSLIRGLNPDPYMREARTFTDNLMDNMPGYSQTLPPKRNALGEPITVRKGLWSDSKTDGVDDELARIIEETGKGITQMAPSRDGFDMRDLELEDGRTAYDRLQELTFQPNPKRPNIRQALAKLFADKRYQELPDGGSDLPGTKSRAIMGMLSKCREFARIQLLRDSQIFRDAVTKRKRETIAAARLKRNAGKAPQKQAPEIKDSGLGMLLDMFNLRPD